MIYFFGMLNHEAIARRMKEAHANRSPGFLQLAEQYLDSKPCSDVDMDYWESLPSANIKYSGVIDLHEACFHGLSAFDVDSLSRSYIDLDQGDDPTVDFTD